MCWYKLKAIVVEQCKETEEINNAIRFPSLIVSIFIVIFHIDIFKNNNNKTNKQIEYVSEFPT